MHGYPEIAEYAAIGDCRALALLSRDGAIDWLCLPHFHSGSIFAALLDRDRGGSFRIAPDQTLSATRRYLDGTNVLETTFKTPTGSFRLIDSMAVHDGKPNAPPDAEREVLRIVEGIAGEPTIRVHFEPRPDYGRASVRLRRRHGLGWACENRGSLLNLLTDVPLESSPDGSLAAGTTTLKPGTRRYFSLTFSAEEVGVIPPLGPSADERLDYTVDWWRHWSSRCRYDGPYSGAVVRSALALKLLTSSITGSVVAAPTTSLPEHLEARRNWDYRYCWLRDTSIVLPTFVDLGYAEEAGAFFNWFMHATRLTSPRLQVMYDIFGRTRLKEFIVQGLEGYAGTGPVRVGNDATEQLQIDVYGAVLRAATAFIEADGKLDETERSLLLQFCRVVCKQWRKPDNGLWEVRRWERHHTYSKLMCWCALQCLVQLHERGYMQGAAPEWIRHEKEAIQHSIETDGFDEDLGAYVGYFGGQQLDAAVLAMPQYGYTEASAPRMASTFARIDQELGHGPLLYRYPPGFDGMESPEGAFLLCSFWAVTYLAQAGRVSEAERRMDALLDLTNDVGLLSEEVDVETGALRGNFPQAFVHASLISAATTIERARRGTRC